MEILLVDELWEIDPDGSNSQGTLLRDLPSGLSSANGMTAFNNRLLLADSTDDPAIGGDLYEINPDGSNSQGGLLRDLPNGLNFPNGMTVFNNRLLIVDGADDDLWEIDPDGSSSQGTRLRALPSGLTLPVSMAVYTVITLPDAVAPTITIGNISTVPENTTQVLSTSIFGGTYDNLSYTWSVISGGGSISGSGSSVTYNPPNVTSNTSIRVRCTVTANGTGTNAINGTSDTNNDDEIFTVTPVIVLSDAVAPTVTIGNISTVPENTTQILTASVSGGTYDTLSYLWSIVSGGGTINGNGNTAVYTPPDVSSNTNVTVRCFVTATGTGTNAESGTTDNSFDSESFVVTVVTTLPPVSLPATSLTSPSTVAENSTLTLNFTPSGGTYDTISYVWSVISGGGSVVANSNDPSIAVYTPPDVSVNTTVMVRCTYTITGTGITAQNGSSATNSTTRTFTVTPLLFLQHKAALA